MKKEEKKRRKNSSGSFARVPPLSLSGFSFSCSCTNWCYDTSRNGTVSHAATKQKRLSSSHFARVWSSVTRAGDPNPAAKTALEYHASANKQGHPDVLVPVGLTDTFLGTQVFCFSRCVTIPGLPGDHQYFGPIYKVTGNFLPLPFRAVLGLIRPHRQKKTATVPIEFSKEVKCSMQQRGNQPKIRHPRRAKTRKA